MPSNISSKSTIAKNTVFLYIRTLVLMFVSLFTSRVILKSLGVEDWGTYTAVAGVVTMLSMITGPLAGAISRYITFELGVGDIDKLKKVFSCSMTIQYIYIAVVVLLIETVGVWFLNTKMNISSERMIAANWVLQFALVSFVTTLIATPYNAVIIAHEKMSAFAYIGILDAFLKLGIAYLIFLVGFDRLIGYAALMAIEAFIIRFIYLVYCKRNFSECRRYSLTIDKKLFKGMFGFAGWSMFGGAASVFHSQGINILLNIFGGSIVNAAQGIANQVNGAITTFVTNFTTALNPSIIKAFATGEKKYMLSLIYQGARFSFFLLLFFAVPLLLETRMIVDVWLDQCPAHTIAFIRLIIVNALIDSLSKTVVSGVNANGNIRNYQIIVGGLLILNLPLSYVALKLGAPVEATAVISIVISIIALFSRLMISRKLIGLSVKEYLKDVLLIVSIVIILAFFPPFTIHFLMPKSMIRFFVVVCTGLLSCAISSFFVGCNKDERNSIRIKVRSIVKR